MPAIADANIAEPISNASIPPEHPLLVMLSLISADAVALISSFALAYFIRHVFFGPTDPYAHLLLLASLPFYLIVYALSGQYPGYGVNPVERLKGLSRGTTAVTFGLAAATFLLKDGQQMARLVVLGGWLLALFFVPLARALVQRWLIGLNWWGRPVLVLGAAKTGRMIIHNLLISPELGLRPVACLDDDTRRVGARCNGIPIAGPLHLAPAMAKSLQINTVVVAMPGLSRRRLLGVLAEYTAAFRQVLVIPDLLGLSSLWVTARDINGTLGLEIRQSLLIPGNRLLKRAMDLSLGLVLLAIAAPMLLLLALAIKLASPGPAFFRQEREGLGGRPIRIWKLRTMVPNAETALAQYLANNPAAKTEWEQFMKLKSDPRIIPKVGIFLRRFSLDELPQLLNVVRGEMSLVGPRPFPIYHLERFPEQFRLLRRQVPPGMTGLWQVSARSEGDLGKQEELDSYYIRNWSLWLDIYLLARTVTTVLSGRGAY